MDFAKIPSPCYVLDEALLARNLAVIDRVRRESGAEVIVALKACAMWSVFPELARHSDGATASSLNEARLVAEEFGPAGSGRGQKGRKGWKAHTYAPAYSDDEFAGILEHSSHITFNSLSQFERFKARVFERKNLSPGGSHPGVSCGLRVNPGWSPVETDLYNPALPGSRLGVSELAELPDGIEGLHFHVLCESGAEDLARALEAFEARFGHLLGGENGCSANGSAAVKGKGTTGLKWVNFGGGHLMTREGYDVELLIRTIKDFRARHPHLRVILEPGSAFTWRTGWLVSTVEDIVESDGVRTAMLDVSFACHMPDCLEMPYKPAIVGARDTLPGQRGYRLGGSSCLAGDWMGEWTFLSDGSEGGTGSDGEKVRELKVGDRVVFEDMIHYTMVKTTMFNGVRHPSIAIWEEGAKGENEAGRLRIVREFGYEDYKNRMS